MQNKPFGVNVVKSYTDFNLQAELKLNKGELFSLLGPSGSGKTTLLRLIAGLEKIDSGKIVLDGYDVTHLEPEKRRIGMVFQDYALFPHLNVSENIAYGLKVRKLAVTQIKAKVTEMLALFEIEKLADRNVQQLSGGERQRVALARALAPEPLILLLDEPFSALDYHLRNKLRNELKNYQKKLGFTCIFVTHHQEEALIISDRLGIMHNGRMSQFGTVAEVYEKPNSKQVAEFIGEANFIPCHADYSQTTDRINVMAADFEPFHLKTFKGFQPGPQWFFFRPEDLKFTGDESDGVKISGIVGKIEYMGYMVRLEIEINHYRLIGYTDKSKISIKEGDRINFTLNFESIRLLTS